MLLNAAVTSAIILFKHRIQSKKNPFFQTELFVSC